MTNSLLYVACMMPAFVILALPTGLILGLETRHGMEPVGVDKAIVVTVELADGVDGSKLRVSGEHLKLTAPPLYVQSENLGMSG